MHFPWDFPKLSGSLPTKNQLSIYVKTPTRPVLANFTTRSGSGRPRDAKWNILTLFQFLQIFIKLMSKCPAVQVLDVVSRQLKNGAEAFPHPDPTHSLLGWPRSSLCLHQSNSLQRASSLSWHFTYMNNSPDLQTTTTPGTSKIKFSSY